MPLIQYVGPYDHVTVPTHRISVAARTPVEVSQQAADELLAQADAWQPADTPRTVAKTAQGREG